MARKSRVESTTNKKTSLKIWKTGAYIRLSRDDGTSESLSVQNQRKRLSEFLSQNEDEMEFVDFYIDDGFTGTDQERENFERLLNDIAKKRVNCVVVKDLSRLSRNYADAGNLLDKFFVTHDVRFISLGIPQLDSFKDPKSMESIAVPIQSVINDDFARQTSLKIRDTFDMKRRHGEFIGAFAPYGYQKDPENKNKLIVDEEAAATVQDIFKWFVDDGMSKAGITRKLNELGYLCPAAYKRSKGLKYANPHDKFKTALWQPGTVKNILENPMYLGKMVQGRYRLKSYKVHTQVSVPQEDWFVVDNMHEAIINQDTFDKAQSLHMRDTRTAPSNNILNLFAGFIRCYDCSKAMHRQIVKKPNGTTAYYLCKTYKFQSKTACTRHGIRESALTEKVLNAIRQQISLAVSMRDMIDEINNAPIKIVQTNHLNEQLKKLNEELSRVDNRRKSLYEDWKDGHISEDEYKRYRVDYADECVKISKSIKALEIEIGIMGRSLNKENLIFESFAKHENIQALTRDVIVELVDVIFVKDNKDIVIRFKFGDCFRALTEYVENNKAALIEATA